VQIAIHPETFLSAEALGTGIGDYRPNFQIQGSLNPHHEFLASFPVRQLLQLTAPGLLDRRESRIIEGWLWPADGLKLYEMAYFASGDILELGTYQGLSTCIMAQAIIDSGRKSRIVTVDIKDYNWKQNVEATGVSGLVEFRLGDAVEQLNQLIGEKHEFTFAFVDHSHTYADVAKACPLLPSVLIPGSFVQFHDYNDPRNGTDPDYGVWQAVQDALPSGFEFCGVYGCSGLYRRLPQTEPF
jgi:predicted O-methyltransferase YrrM